MFTLHANANLCLLKSIGYHSGTRIQCPILKDQAAHAEKNLNIC